MAALQNQYSPLAATPGMGVQRADRVDWSQEISPVRPAVPAAAPAQRPAGGTVPAVSSPQLDMKNDLPTEVIDAPTTVGEAEAGSWKAMLSRNLGNFVVATFLIGTQGTVVLNGKSMGLVLYSGNQLEALAIPVNLYFFIIIVKTSCIVIVVLHHTAHRNVQMKFP